MRRLFVMLGMLILVVSSAEAEPPWNWLRTWSEDAPRLGVLASEISFQAPDSPELPYGVQVSACSR